MTVGTYFEINDNPDDLAGRGAILSALGEDLNAKAGAILGDIHGIEAERPWGDDSFGQQFWHSYNQPAQDSSTPFREELQDSLAQAGQPLTQVGDKTVRAMTEYQGTDAENAADLNSVQP
jgi:hypothetical protein